MAGLFGRFGRGRTEYEPLSGMGGGLYGRAMGVPAGAISLTGDQPTRGFDELKANASAQPNESDNDAVRSDVSGEKKQGWLSKVGEFFGYKKQQPQYDTQGLPVPQEPQEGIGHKIMRYAVPAMFGMSGGVGVLPGIMTAMAQGAKGRSEQAKYGQEYLKQKQEAEQARAGIAFKEKQLEDLNKYRAAVLAKKGGGGRGVGEATSADEAAAYNAAAPALKEQLKKASPAELADAMASSDPRVKKAASYMMKSRRKFMPKEFPTMNVNVSSDDGLISSGMGGGE